MKLLTNKLTKGSIYSLLFAMVLIALSCSNGYIYKGNKNFDAMAYQRAVKFYEKVSDKKATIDVRANTAESYFMMNNLDKSRYHYSKIINDENIHPRHYIIYSRTLMGDGNCKEAKIWLKKYLAVNKEDVLANMLLSSCNSINDRMRDTTLFTLEPIVLDQFENYFGPVNFKDGIVFTADKEVILGSRTNPWTGDSYLSLYEMQKGEDGAWLDPKLLKGDINGPFHNGPATFSADGNTVFFTRNNAQRRRLVTDDSNVSNLRIFKATYENGKWTNLEDLPFNSDDYSTGHPTLSADGKTLYFVSDMPGGFGGTDLYKVHFDGEKWGNPINLGNTVNTPGNEMFPYIHTDGSLYFSSDGHNTMGGLDVFITYHSGERWMQPENLNYPLNSTKDDFAFVLNPDNMTGYVSSTRTNKDKIYSFQKHAPTFNLIGLTRNKETRKPIEKVKVDIKNLDKGEITTLYTDNEGGFKLRLLPETDYEIMCEKEGFFSVSDKLSTKGLKFSEDFIANFDMLEMIIQKPIVLENIHYDFDKWNIREDAAIELDKLVKILRDNPKIHIEMSSHTDSRGTEQYNLVLSDKRAKAAVDYLVYRGIDIRRLTWKGYGKTKPLINCYTDKDCTEEQHQKNRRTEFKVIKIDK
jgi:peptidoglycan-associated lipoprotein